MLLKRLIVCLDVRDGRVTKGVRFQGNVDVGDPVELAARYTTPTVDNDGRRRAGADELVYYDITASAEKRAIDLDPVRALARSLNVPLTVGGGLRNLDDLREALRAGADKVSVNSLAVARPDLLAEGARQFGRQCIVLGLDARAVPSDTPLTDDAGHPVANGPASDASARHAAAVAKGGAPSRDGVRYEVVVEGGRRPTGWDAVAWARRATALGAGEICVNAIDTDGVGDGYALALTRAIAEAVDVPVIASGGAGTVEDIAAAWSDAPGGGGADAALVASMVHGGRFTCAEIKRALAARGFPLRIFEGAARRPSTPS